MRDNARHEQVASGSYRHQSQRDANVAVAGRSAEDDCAVSSVQPCARVPETHSCVHARLAIVPPAELHCADCGSVWTIDLLRPPSPELAQLASRRGRPRMGLSDPDLPALDAVERAYTLHVLASCRGNVTASCRVLRVDRRTLYRHLRDWGFR